jgi:hypothetical protein
LAFFVGQIMLARTLCNVLAHDESKMAVLRAGALDVLRIVGTLPIQEVQEDCIRIITFLGQQPEARPFVLREDVLSVLILYIRSSNATLFEHAMEALSTLSSCKELRRELVALGCAGAIVHAALSGKIETKAVIEESARCLRYLSNTEEEVNRRTRLAAVAASLRN